jgi:glycosyltransferase involved in cell wall biosynthesis
VPGDPRVTIVIPTYDRAATYLPAAIESVLGQEGTDVELVVIDDASTDRTPDLLTEYAGRHPDRLRWERLDDNVGQIRALNRGFELASGELVGQIGDDDVLLPGAAARLAAALEGQPEAVAAYPGYRLIDESGATVDTIAPREHSLAESLRLNDILISIGALVRAEVLERLGGWDPAFRYCADFDFWNHVALEGPIVLVPEPLAARREHPGALTRAEQSPRMARERIELLDKLYARDDLPPEVLAVREEAYRSAYCVAALISGAGDPESGGRFFIADGQAAEISQAAGSEDPHVEIARLRARIARLEDRVAQRDEQLQRLRDRRGAG